MRKLLIIIIVVMMVAGCSSSQLGDYSGRGQSQITITLDRFEGRDYPAGSVIYRAQKKLKQIGYNPGPLDGVWGSKTQKAVKQFQQDSGLPVTGNLDAETRRQLLPMTNGDQKGGSVGRQQKYSLMTAQEARQLIEKHIRKKDIRLETNTYYRKRFEHSDSEPLEIHWC